MGCSGGKAGLRQNKRARLVSRTFALNMVPLRQQQPVVVVLLYEMRIYHEETLLDANCGRTGPGVIFVTPAFAGWRQWLRFGHGWDAQQRLQCTTAVQPGGADAQ